MRIVKISIVDKYPTFEIRDASANTAQEGLIEIQVSEAQLETWNQAIAAYARVQLEMEQATMPQKLTDASGNPVSGATRVN